LTLPSRVELTLVEVPVSREGKGLKNQMPPCTVGVITSDFNPNSKVGNLGPSYPFALKAVKSQWVMNKAV
jgi:hypothetical protein